MYLFKCANKYTIFSVNSCGFLTCAVHLIAVVRTVHEAIAPVGILQAGLTISTEGRVHTGQWTAGGYKRGEIKHLYELTFVTTNPSVHHSKTLTTVGLIRAVLAVQLSVTALPVCNTVLGLHTEELIFSAATRWGRSLSCQWGHSAMC